MVKIFYLRNRGKMQSRKSALPDATKRRKNLARSKFHGRPDHPVALSLSLSRRYSRSTNYRKWRSPFRPSHIVSFHLPPTVDPSGCLVNPDACRQVSRDPARDPFYSRSDLPGGRVFPEEELVLPLPGCLPSAPG